MMTNYPCKGCTDRVVGCHSTCQKYQDAKAEYESEKAAILKSKKAENDYADFKVNTVIATIKKSGKRR
jgi:hypothetical protein